MSFFRKKESAIARLLKNKYVIGFCLLALVIAISIPLAKNAGKRYVINSEIRKLEDEISEMKKKNSELSGLVSYLESEQFVAEQARLNLNYKKEGEEVVVIKSKDDTKDIFSALRSDARGESAGDDDKKSGNPKKWLKYFFGNIN